MSTLSLAMCEHEEGDSEIRILSISYISIILRQCK